MMRVVILLFDQISTGEFEASLNLGAGQIALVATTYFALLQG